jgi:hypothetical protein
MGEKGREGEMILEKKYIDTKLPNSSYIHWHCHGCGHEHCTAEEKHTCSLTHPSWLFFEVTHIHPIKDVEQEGGVAT